MEIQFNHVKDDGMNIYEIILYVPKFVNSLTQSEIRNFVQWVIIHKYLSHNISFEFNL